MKDQLIRGQAIDGSPSEWDEWRAFERGTWQYASQYLLLAFLSERLSHKPDFRNHGVYGDERYQLIIKSATLVTPPKPG